MFDGKDYFTISSFREGTDEALNDRSGKESL